MIVFYTNKFELNLTHIKLNLNEENSLFYDYFLKNYSLPFSLNLNDSTASDLVFITEENILIDTIKYSGSLLVDNIIYEAELHILKSEDNIIEGVVNYGLNVGALLETLLKNLHFPIIKGVSIATHASSILDKTYPEIDHNFPMIIDHAFKENSNYEDFKGIKNYRPSGWVFNSTIIEDGVTRAINYNILTPLPYILGILRTGFNMAGLNMIGDFFNDKAIEKLLLDTDKFVEKFVASNNEDFSFSTETLQIVEGNDIIFIYTKTFTTTAVGQYRLKTFLSLPNRIKIKSFEIKNGNTTLLKSYVNNEVNNFVIDVDDISQTGDIIIELKIFETSFNDLSDHAFLNFYLAGANSNTYPDQFSLAEVMPNMTFGGYLTKLKNWFNLDISLTKSTATINFIENHFLELNFTNHKKYEIKNKSIKYNALDFFRLKYNESQQLLISKTGVELYQTVTSNKVIKTINAGVSVLQKDTHLEIITAARKQSNSEFRVVIYDGLQNAKNTTLFSIFDKTFDLDEVYKLYWFKWLNYRLNSVEITDKFIINALENLDIKEGYFKYNQKQLFKRLSKTRISEDQWEVTAISETLR